MSVDLIERLRRDTDEVSPVFIVHVPLRDLRHEAADHIASLESRIARLTAEATKCEGCGVNELQSCQRPPDKACWREFHGGSRAARSLSDGDM